MEIPTPLEIYGMLLSEGLNAEYLLEEMSNVEMLSVMKEFHNKFKERTEALRLQCYYSVASKLKKGTSINTFWPLDWDNENKPLSTKQDFELATKRLNKILELNNIKL